MNALALTKSALDAELISRGRSFRPLRALQSSDGKFKDDAQRKGFDAGAAIDVYASVGAGNKIAGVIGR